MMQSVALTESNVLEMDVDNDFVLVDCSMMTSSQHQPQRDSSSNDVSSHIIHEEENDDDYDYCDDALSEGMQSVSGFDLTEDMILEEAETPSIQSILDEAHKEAKMLIQSSFQEKEEEEKKDELQDEPKSSLAGSLESVQPSSSALGSSMTNVTLLRGPRKVSVCSEEEAAVRPPPSMQEEQNDISDVDEDDDDDASIATANTHHSSSRLSNKKRRKKMKLFKKARAAATAKARLAEVSSGSSPDIKASQFKAAKKTTATRYHNRRVATVPAVACASETLALYKAQVAHGAGAATNGKPAS